MAKSSSRASSNGTTETDRPHRWSWGFPGAMGSMDLDRLSTIQPPPDPLIFPGFPTSMPQSIAAARAAGSNVLNLVTAG